MKNDIISKLNVFIRKYYKNLLLKGIVYTFLLLIIFFVILNIIEYIGWNPPLVRTVIFYFYIFLTVIVFVIWILIPLGKLFSIGKTISYSQAAQIIGKHFPEVKDKLLNLLQLQKLNRKENLSNELLDAAIKQKTEQLSPIPFINAIDKRPTKKFAKILFGIIFLIVIISVIFPKLFSEPSIRYLNHSSFYEKPAPFSFEIISPLKYTQHTDAEIQIKVSGKILPNNVTILLDGQDFEMKKKNKTHFFYTISQIQKSMSVQFVSSGVTSKIYSIEVNPKPVLNDLSAEIIYPEYTKIPSEKLVNITDLSVPKGTKIIWYLKTKDCSSVDLYKENEDSEKIKYFNYITDKKGSIIFSEQYFKDEKITIKPKNSYLISNDSLQFTVSVAEDRPPQIAVIEQKDSLLVNNLYFRGQIKDDYGFSKLEFHIDVYSDDNTGKKSFVKSLNVNSNENAQEFYHSENISEYNINNGNRVEYYFEVWDNDAVNGCKSTKSQMFSFTKPTLQQVENQIENNSSEIKQKADKTISEIKKLQSQINELIKKLSQKNELSWQDNQELQQLKQKQSEIREEIRQMQNKMSDNQRLENNYSQIDDELLEKQKQIEELFNQLENKELENLLQQIDDLTKKQLDKDKINEKLKNIQSQNAELSKQLDKNIELYKRLEVEKNINEIVDKLKDLADKQKKLSEKTDNKNVDKEEINKQQKQLNEEFEQLQKKMKDVDNKDKNLESPFGFKRNFEKESSIKQDQQKASDNLKQGNSKKSSQYMKSASEKLNQMAEQIQTNQDENQQEQLAEDIDNVRNILKNLVTLSKQQEDLIYSTQRTAVSDPNYQNIINKENFIKESMVTIADSLYQISKRQIQVSKTISEETLKVNSSINQTIESLLKYNQSLYQSYKNNQASKNQQYAMTSMNNLALLLAESLDNMNKQQSNDKNKKNASNASQQCNNPSSSGQSKKDPKTMSQLQEALNKEIQRLQKELEKKSSSMQKQKIGENKQLNERLAKAAAQQEMIRKMMQEYLEQIKQEGGKAAGDMNKILKQMEETQKDIVNKRITTQTINRQNQILTRMLESDKAQKRKDKEQKRESVSGIDKNRNSDENFEAFKKLKNRELELFKKIPPVYSSYYKDKINKYFLNFED